LKIILAQARIEEIKTRFYAAMGRLAKINASVAAVKAKVVP